MVETCGDYAIYMLDPRGYITSWNLGRSGSRDTLPTRPSASILLVLPAEHTERGDPGLQLEFARSREGTRAKMERAQGRLAVLAHVIVTRLLDESGKLRGFSRITHDITERRRAEEDSTATRTA